MVKSKKYTGVYHREIENVKTYYITYKHNGKKIWVKIGRHSEGVREAYCAKKRANIIAKIRLGEVPNIIKNKRSKKFDAIVSDFFKSKRYAPETKKDYMSRYSKYIKSHIGHKTPVQIVQDDILNIHDAALKKVSLKTARLIVEFVNSVFIFAIESKETDENPCKKIKLPKFDNTRDRFLDKEEIEMLLEECRGDEDLYLFVLLALTTGGRLGAICNIKKKDININSMTVNLLDDKNDEMYQVFLAKKAAKELALDDLLPNDFIFQKQQRTIQRKLQKILNELFNKELEKDDRKNRVVVHTLRHTFASHLAINGTPIFTIQKLMNHKDITHTLRYAKLAPDSGRDMIEGIL